MRSFDSDTLAMLASGRAVARDLLLFDLGSGLYGFWTGVGVLTYQDVDYVGAGRLIGIEAPAGVSDLSSVPLVVTLSAIPDSALSPDVLGTIEAEQYHQRPVVISRAYIDPDSRAVLSVERIYRGYVDRIEHEDQVGGGAVLRGYLESKARDHGKRGHRTRSDTDQRRIDAADGGLRHAATAGSQTIYWGRNPEQAGRQAD